MPNARNRLAAPLLAALALTFATLVLAAAPARAEDPAKPVDATAAADAACPDVYGVWETAYLVGKPSPGEPYPYPLAPGEWWGGLLMKAYIDKDKAALVWMKDHAGNKASAIYKRFSKYKQSDHDLSGEAAGGAVVEVHSIQGIFDHYGDEYTCMLMVTDMESDAIGAKIHNDVIMRKMK